MHWSEVAAFTGNAVYAVHLGLMALSTRLEPPRADNPVLNSLRYRVLYAVANAASFNRGRARNALQPEPRTPKS